MTIEELRHWGNGHEAYTRAAHQLKDDPFTSDEDLREAIEDELETLTIPLESAKEIANDLRTNPALMKELLGN